MYGVRKAKCHTFTVRFKGTEERHHEEGVRKAANGRSVQVGKAVSVVMPTTTSKPKPTGLRSFLRLGRAGGNLPQFVFTVGLSGSTSMSKRRKGGQR